jgi:hypothetical protein
LAEDDDELAVRVEEDELVEDEELEDINMSKSSVEDVGEESKITTPSSSPTRESSSSSSSKSMSRRESRLKKGFLIPFRVRRLCLLRTGASSSMVLRWLRESLQLEDIRERDEDMMPESVED